MHKLRAIVEQKIESLTEEDKIKFAKAVECLAEYIQSQKEKETDEDTPPESQDVPNETDSLNRVIRRSQTAPDTLTTEEIDLKTKLDHEIRKENELEGEIQKDETIIKQESKQKLSNLKRYN